MFFERSDGIFLNYTWNTEQLAKSKQLCTNKGRPYDVFVGVDVFGRGCYKGGGYNTNKVSVSFMLFYFITLLLSLVIRKKYY